MKTGFLGLTLAALATVFGSEARKEPVGAGRSFLVVAEPGISVSDVTGSVVAAGGTAVRSIPGIGVVVAESPDPRFPDALRTDPAVAGVAPNVRSVRSLDAGISFGLDEVGPEVEALADNPPTSTDNDALFNVQWNLDAIDAPEAWEAGYRGAGVRVAVLDSGMNPDHVDFGGRVNMALARSFVPNEGVDPRPLPPPPRPFAVAHGTFVAGIIGAGDNGVGMIGVAPEVEIVPIKVLSAKNNWGTWDGVIEGIVYAADVEADVINLSLGGWLNHRLGYDENGTPDPSDDVPLTAAEVQAICTAMARATEYAHSRGATIVAGTGNNTYDGDHDADRIFLPAQAPHVIAVSATSPRGWAIDPTTDPDVPTPYTNYGRSMVHLAAPGGYADPNVVGIRTLAGITQQARFFDLVLSALPVGNWGFAAGTSFATPHVSGVAALVIGRNGGSMHPDRVRAILERTSDDVGTPGNDEFFGAGRVNARAAVEAR